MKKSLFGISLVITVFISSASNADETADKQVLDVYNEYYSSIKASNYCGGEKFKDAAEKAKFEKNFAIVRQETKEALKRHKPDFTDAKLEDNIKFMNEMVDSSMAKFYKDGGCSNEVLQEALIWHDNFVILPPIQDDKKPVAKK